MNFANIGAGYTGIAGMVMDIKNEIAEKYLSQEARLAGSYALNAGCQTNPRDCLACTQNQACRVKRYIPDRVT